jgi:hypothetical protein
VIGWLVSLHNLEDLLEEHLSTSRKKDFVRDIWDSHMWKALRAFDGQQPFRKSCFFIEC